MSSRRVLAACISVTSPLALLFACLDVTPITVAPRDAGFLPEASCTVCLERPPDNGCGEILGSCRSDPRCAPVLTCLEAKHCFDRPTLDDKLTCGLPCVIEAGITRTDDPTVQRLLDLVQCGQMRCAVACNLTDAGLGFDAL
jgi:hypothetical protein